MITQLRRLLGRSSPPDAKGGSRERLEAAKRAALQPTLYASWGVPDTFDGRFEAVLALVSVEFARLTRESKAAEADALLTAFMQDVELALQSSGVSEAGMRKKMRAVETASFARVERLGRALRDGAGTQEEILNSMFGGAAEAGAQAKAAADKLDRLLHQLYAEGRRLDDAAALIETPGSP